MIELQLVILNVRFEGKTAPTFTAQPHDIQIIRMHLPEVRWDINGFKE